MNYIVLSQHVPPRLYRDEVGVSYNYPPRYRNRIAPGDRFIYHQPRGAGGERDGMVYFGCGVIGEISEDDGDENSLNAELLDYVRFQSLVTVVHRGRFREPDITRPANLIGNAVRIISMGTACSIIDLARTSPPWAWEESPETGPEANGVTQTEQSDAVLRQRLSELDRKYEASNPQERRRLLTALHRPSSMANTIKRLYGTTCSICGMEGFEKRDGSRYAEVHHVEELSAGMPGSLGSRNIMVVCANCHRMLHYAQVEVDDVKYGWRITVNAQEYLVKRLT